MLSPYRSVRKKMLDSGGGAKQYKDIKNRRISCYCLSPILVIGLTIK
jgi:hypothetical protein